MKAAYRFLDNEHVTAISILAPHRDATIERNPRQTVVLIVQDTTELDITRPNEVMAGAGPLNDSSRVGFHDHVSLAMTPEHLVLGVVDAKIWARDPVEFEKDADQKRTERRAKSIEEKESFRWVEGYSAACHVAQEVPETHIISLADSEEDIYEYLLEGQAVEGAHKASFIIRACQNRPWWCQTRLRPRSRTGFCGSRSRAHQSSRNEASRFGDATPSRRMIGSESNHASPARL